MNGLQILAQAAGPRYRRKPLASARMSCSGVAGTQPHSRLPRSAGRGGDGTWRTRHRPYHLDDLPVGDSVATAKVIDLGPAWPGRTVPPTARALPGGRRPPPWLVRD